MLLYKIVQFINSPDLAPAHKKRSVGQQLAALDPRLRAHINASRPIEKSSNQQSRPS